jgi:nucleolar complex protein 3
MINDETNFKFEKQVRKLDAELKEALEKESSNRKLKFATETMKHVFLTYFRVLKRMPSSALLAPVLEGLNKFVHLISVEFFDDLILLMGRLIEQTVLILNFE